MSDLRIQRALLCFLVVMGLVLMYWGITVPDWWLAAMVGSVLTVWAAYAVLRVNREIRARRAYLSVLMKDVAFLHELRLSGGRVEAAQQAFEKKKREGLYR
jgi:hypothetical protein